MRKAGSTCRARPCSSRGRKTNPLRAGAAGCAAADGADPGISAVGQVADGASADRANALIVADTENSKQEENQPENQDLKQLQDLYDLMQAEGLDSIELED